MSRPLGGFLVDACEQVCQEQKPLTDKHTDPENRGGNALPVPSTSISFSVSLRLEVCPLPEWRLSESSDVLVASVRSSTTTMHDTHDPDDSTDSFDGFDGSNLKASNGKSQDGGGQLTRLTDLTVSERGVYVPPARPPAPARPLALPSTPSTTTVKSVKSVKSQDGGGWFSPPCRQTRCQFDGSARSGVVR